MREIHSRFVKDRELYFETHKLYEKLDQHYKNIIMLDELGFIKVNFDIYELEEKNKSEYYDLLTTQKIENRGKSFYSYNECVDFVKNPENQTEINNLKILKQFWENNPNGLVYFV